MNSTRYIGYRLAFAIIGEHLMVVVFRKNPLYNFSGDLLMMSQDIHPHHKSRVCYINKTKIDSLKVLIELAQKVADSVYVLCDQP